MSDIESTTPNPESLQPVLEVIFRSLDEDNLLPLANQAPCQLPAKPVPPNIGLSWSYEINGCPDTVKIVINRGWVPVTPDNTKSVGTSVQVTYKYHWRFNSAIQLLFPGVSYTTTDITETATVHNQT